MPAIPLLGLAFPDATIDAIAGWMLARPQAAPFDYVVTPNADHLVRLRRDPALSALYRDAALRLLDSRVVARIATAIGLPTPPVIPGSDITAMLLRRLPANEPITVIGLAPAFLPALEARYAITVAHHSPPIGFERDPAAMQKAVRFVLDHRSRFVLLAVGSPRQEMLAAAIKEAGGATGLGLCVGASLDFLTGAARRAPRWMQAASLEWLHRLATNPRRLARRYLLDDPPVFGLLLRERLLGPAS
ncbi:MAG: WecB/TagA/CpsF family glycosyltransferase [Acetobacteraceae bacterium]